MQRARSAALLAAFVVVVVASSAVSCRAQLANNYYAGKCGNSSVEDIIRSAVQARLVWDKRMVAGLLHLMFHDCFVTGCDASILLDGPNTEKTAVQNTGIFGYDFIDDVKTALENCGGPSYQVQLGRRDGMVSQAYMASILPGPNVDIPTAIDLFSKKGLNSFDMAILMGAHTVGVTHCSVIHDRLYNFNGTGLPDPAMDPLYVWILTSFACPKGQTFDNIVYLDDPSSILIVDKSYYSQIVKRHGVLSVDQALGDHSSTAWMVNFLATTDFFPSMFSYALNKLAALDVLTGTAGEIRKNCRSTN
ncbi:hypothetical protein HU200_041942 [Digitaria exilis]|uniref:Peroxidase n=1 Tax=Digitaria exilis TaxID=1010633 RepID=A0A835EHK2_9POAL|nr:hypothetical protein HU200_041942 [Digitaria exilis]CAB3495217.1 unnamed protein product [Digitaria exilis]